MTINANSQQGKQQHYYLNNQVQLKVAILSDTHGYLDAGIINHIKGSDLVVHAGDICDARILTDLAGICGQVIAVAGNNDLPIVWPLEQHAMVTALPDTATVDIPGGRLVIEHGHRLGMYPDHGELRKAHPEARMIVYGHTHRILCDQEESPWVVNPGAAGATRIYDGASCIILEASDHEWKLNMKQCHRNVS